MSGEPVELNKLNEKSQFMNEQKTKDEQNQVTCCRSKHTKNCCIATGVFGCIFLVLGKFDLLHTYFVNFKNDLFLEQLYYTQSVFIRNDGKYHLH